MLFVLLNADRISASSHRIEIRRYDLSKIENPVYWDALANFILHNDRSDTIEARYFLIWLNNRKKALCEDPCRINDLMIFSIKFLCTDTLFSCSHAPAGHKISN